jgi:hypothetical protein
MRLSGDSWYFPPCQSDGNWHFRFPSLILVRAVRPRWNRAALPDWIGALKAIGGKEDRVEMRRNYNHP